MDTIKILATRSTPHVFYDELTTSIRLEGVSLPEDAKGFYDPLKQQIKEFKFNRNRTSMVCFRLDYFNTSSAKAILDLLLTIDELFRQGQDVGISWEYNADDPELREVGEEFGLLIKCPIRLIEY